MFMFRQKFNFLYLQAIRGRYDNSSSSSSSSSDAVGQLRMTHEREADFSPEFAKLLQVRTE